MTPLALICLKFTFVVTALHVLFFMLWDALPYFQLRRWLAYIANLSLCATAAGAGMFIGALIWQV